MGNLFGSAPPSPPPAPDPDVESAKRKEEAAKAAEQARVAAARKRGARSLVNLQTPRGIEREDDLRGPKGSLF